MTPTYWVQCPVCGAPPGWRCRTLTTNRVTDTHTARTHAKQEQTT